MDKYFLSHMSALAYWELPLVHEYFDPWMRSDIKEVTVFNKNQLNQRQNQRVFCMTQALPPNAKRLTSDACVVAPELAFFQMARQMDIQRLILLGILMCAIPYGETQKQLTNRKKLFDFVRQMRGHGGYRNAMRALNYVADGCWSIMEAFLFMFLTLPSSLGGCGFGGAVFNHRIELDSDGARLLGQRFCYVDLYFHKWRIIVEYDSLQEHASAKAQARDAIRSNALELLRSRLPYRLISVKPVQLYDPEAFTQLRQQFARLIGRKIRDRNRSHERMHQNLHELLPRQPNAVSPAL